MSDQTNEPQPDDEPAESPFATTLVMPTHPHHQLDADPTGQPEYANPVTANNYEILYSNALMQLTDRKVQLNARLRAARKQLTDAERERERIERRLMRTNMPTNQAHVKTLKLQAAYIEKLVEASGRQGEYDALGDRIAQLEDTIDDLKVRIENAGDWIKTIMVGGTHLQTFLSFYKAERRSMERGL